MYERMLLHTRFPVLIASVAVPLEQVERFDLLMGVHPVTRLPLSEQEDDAARIAWLWDGAVRDPDDRFTQALLLWRSRFPAPGLAPHPDGDAYYRRLWDLAFEGCQVLACAYAYYPSIHTKGGHAEYTLCHDEAASIQKRLERIAEAHPSRRTGNATWTFPVSARCPLGDIVDERGGLSAQLKKRLRLDGVAPGLLYNYLSDRGMSLHEVLSARQFEDLAAEVFRAEGWDVHQTKLTRDGGKDLVVRRDGTTAYVQAKRYGPAVGISEVKEFVATVAGDAPAVKRGYVVTTSHYSPDAERWLTTKGLRLAEIELINGAQLWDKLKTLSSHDVPAYFVGRDHVR